MIEPRLVGRLIPVAAIGATLLVAGCPRTSEHERPDVQFAPDCEPVRALGAAELSPRLWVVIGHSLMDLDVAGGRRPVFVTDLSEFDDIASEPWGAWVGLTKRTPAKVTLFDTWPGELDTPEMELFDRSGEGELHVSLAGSKDHPKLAVWLRRSTPTPVNVGPVHNWADARTAPRSGLPTLSGNADWLAITNLEGTSVHPLTPAGVGEGTVLPCPIDPAEPRDAAPRLDLAFDGTLGCLLETDDGMQLVRFARDGTRTQASVFAGARGLLALDRPWMPGDLAWLVFGDEAAIELIGVEGRERIELPFVPRQISALEPELLAVVDAVGHFAVVRRDGTLRYSSLCGPASGR